MTNKFLSKLLVLEIISSRLRKPLSLGSNRVGLGIPNPTETADGSYRISLVCRKRLVESLVIGETLSTL